MSNLYYTDLKGKPIQYSFRFWHTNMTCNSHINYLLELDYPQERFELLSCLKIDMSIKYTGDLVVCILYKSKTMWIRINEVIEELNLIYINRKLLLII